MEKFAPAGDFCPNTACPDYGKLQADQTQPSIRKFGTTKRGVQRYQCKTCGQTFTDTTGTIFFRKRTPAQTILETLALLAEGSRIRSVSRVKGVKEATILQWLREAAQQAERLEDVRLAEFKVTRGQLDALWSSVRNTGEKKLSRDG